GDFTFLNWTNNATSIAANATASATYTANYNAKLLVLTNIYYENVAEGEETVPYLIVEGTFKAAEKAYLFLYEGNRQISLKGTEITGQRDEAFELKFDLRELTKAVAEDGSSFQGAWMDIKFRAEFGDIVEEMAIDLNNYADDFADVDQQIVNGGYSFYFQVYEPANGARDLKAVYGEYKYSYDMTFENGALKISGVVYDPQLFGKAVKIDLNTAETTAYGAIDGEGKWTVVIDMDGLPRDTTGYAHFAVVESVPTEEVPTPAEVYRDGSDGNLANGKWVTEQATEVYGVDLITGKAIREASNTDRVFYIGDGKWGGIIAYVRSERVSNEAMSLEVIEGKVYVVYSGEGGYASKEQAESDLKATFAYVDVMEDTAWTSVVLSDINAETPVSNIIIEVEDPVNGIYKFKVKLPVEFAESNTEPTNHFYFFHAPDSSSNLARKGEVTDGTLVSAGDYNYRLVHRTDADDWKKELVWVEVLEQGAKDYQHTVDVFDANSLVVEDGRVYLVITGTCNDYEPEDITADLQNIDDGWKEVLKGGVATIAEGRYTLKVDLTDLEANNSRLFGHIHFAENGEDKQVDFPYPEAEAGTVASVTENGKTYTIEVFIFTDWGNQARRLVRISAAE
ncbi:MAG: hypothetical protein J6Z36_01260, partial [Clostridia bacterium]|nr:hypothetical protein [Clostridia bacterium]